MKDQFISEEKALAPKLQGLSEDIFYHPETGHREVYACGAHKALLEKEGFTVETGIADMETAFQGVFDSGKEGPVICFMAEYDALPEIGHGCGHNILGAASTGAAILLSRFLDKTGGKVVILGTPAEETDGGKVGMAEKGIFKGMDVALMAHPGTKYRLSGNSLAMEAIAFEFFGETAHASGEPWNGVNALEAQIAFFNNINGLRLRMKKDGSVHGIIRNGGAAANVIPDYTKSEFYIRAGSKKYLRELKEKVIACAEGAALATGCTMKYGPYELGYDDMVTNTVLNEVFRDAVSLFSDLPCYDAEPAGGSSDAGNVSHVVPTIHGYFPICEGEIPGHTREFAAATLTDYAYDRLDEIVQILAYTGYRVLREPELLAAIKEEFQRGLEEGVIIPPEGAL